MSGYEVSVELVNFDKLANKLGGAVVFIRQIARGIIRDATLTAEDRAKRTVPVDTGVLRASIQSRLGDYEGRVATNIAYARHQEYGTRPHEIRAVNKRVLANKKKGLIFGPRVMHPGFKGRFYFKAGAEAARDKLSSLLKDAGKTIINFLSF